MGKFLAIGIFIWGLIFSSALVSCGGGTSKSWYDNHGCPVDTYPTFENEKQPTSVTECRDVPGKTGAADVKPIPEKVDPKPTEKVVEVEEVEEIESVEEIAEVEESEPVEVAEVEEVEEIEPVEKCTVTYADSYVGLGYPIVRNTVCAGGPLGDYEQKLEARESNGDYLVLSLYRRKYQKVTIGNVDGTCLLSSYTYQYSIVSEVVTSETDLRYDSFCQAID